MKQIFGPEASIFREYVPDIAAFLEEEKVGIFEACFTLY